MSEDLRQPPSPEQAGSKVAKNMAGPKSRALNAWGTAVVWRSAGCQGLPRWADCDDAQARRGVLVADPPLFTQQELDEMRTTMRQVDKDNFLRVEQLEPLEESGRLYDATPRKYEPGQQKPTIDTRVMAAVVAVESAVWTLRLPQVFRCYLAFKWPQWGRMVPSRPPKWHEDPADVFLDTVAAREHLLGNLRNAQVDRSARSLLLRMEREFLRELRP